MIELHRFDIAASSSQADLAGLVERNITRSGLPAGLEGLQEIADILIKQPAEDPRRFVHGLEARGVPSSFENAGHFALLCLAATVKQRSEGAAYLSLDPPGFREHYAPSGLQGHGYRVTAGLTALPNNPTEYAPRGLVIGSMGNRPIPASWVKRK